MQVKSKTFQDLIVWQKAHSFVLDTYSITKKFPKEELYRKYPLFFEFRLQVFSCVWHYR
ncbi:MAG: four helix bundle protein [Deltaproteobacteria bacterium]|nr:four helix bundle protein [Deltaproteobacteria bacterium]